MKDTPKLHERKPPKNLWLEESTLVHIEGVLCKITQNEDLRDAVHQVFRRLKAAEALVEKYREQERRRLAKTNEKSPSVKPGLKAEPTPATEDRFDPAS